MRDWWLRDREVIERDGGWRPQVVTPTDRLILALEVELGLRPRPAKTIYLRRDVRNGPATGGP